MVVVSGNRVRKAAPNQVENGVSCGGGGVGGVGDQHEQLLGGNVVGVDTNQQSAAGEMPAKAVLQCRPNSHPFQERTLLLDTPVKVGRSVARARPAPYNAIFDCKVLSRHHALIWYENGKFYLQDTKSSNGTFVNNNRLSDGGKESSPREISSGDIVQFGVDVVENNRRVTHGCIVVTLKLYLPDGKEAKASHSVGALKSANLGNADELYRLAQHLQEAVRREQQLETKLVSLQRLVEQAKQGAELGWRAAVDEDRLLSRVALLESQLRSFSKNCTDENIREELLKLQEDKTAYQNAAKESLQKLHKERLDALDKITVLERAAITAEEERIAAMEHCRVAQEELRQLALQLSDSQRLTSELTEKLAETENEDSTLRTKVNELTERERILNLKLDAMEGLALNPNILSTLKADLVRAQQQVQQNTNDLHNQDMNENNEEARKVCQRIQQQIDILENTVSSRQEILNSDLIKDNELDDDETGDDECKDFNDIDSTTSSTIMINSSVQQDMINHDGLSNGDADSAIDMLAEIKRNDIERENERLRHKLVESEQIAKECRNEAQQLRDKVNNLMSELEKRVEISNDKSINDLEMMINKLKSENKSLEMQLTQLSLSALTASSSASIFTEEHIQTVGDESIELSLPRITELEDELVLVKERHAQCLPEHNKLQEELIKMRCELNQMKSRSQTNIFCYTAPLVLIIAYLLLHSLFA